MNYKHYMLTIKNGGEDKIVISSPFFKAFNLHLVSFKLVQVKDRWILTGSLCGWGDVFIHKFDLAIFLYVPQELRIKRLMERERKRFGEKIDKGGSMHATYNNFIDWASKYDAGDETIRSKILHEKWSNKLSCRVIKLEGDLTIEQKVNAVLQEIDK